MSFHISRLSSSSFKHSPGMTFVRVLVPSPLLDKGIKYIHKNITEISLSGYRLLLIAIFIPTSYEFELPYWVQ